MEITNKIKTLESQLEKDLHNLLIKYKSMAQKLSPEIHDVTRDIITEKLHFDLENSKKQFKDKYKTKIHIF